MNNHRINEYIFLCLLALLSYGALRYGFTVVLVPSEQRAIMLDDIRVQDLNAIIANVGEYYQTANKLPNTLRELPNPSPTPSDAFVPTKSPFLDPETNQPYLYVVYKKAYYKLCATFDTQTIQSIANIADQNSDLSTSPIDFTKHIKGYNCYEITPYNGGLGVVEGQIPTINDSSSVTNTSTQSATAISPK